MTDNMIYTLVGVGAGLILVVACIWYVYRKGR